MKFIQWIIDKRFIALWLAIILYITINTLSFATENITNIHILHIIYVVASAFGMLFICVFICFIIYIDKLDRNQKIEGVVKELSPSACVFFNKMHGDFFAESNFWSLMNIKYNKNYDFEDLRIFFSKHQWSAIVKQFDGSIADQRICGNIERMGKHIKYICTYMVNNQLDMHGICILFEDVTELREHELQVLSSLKHYKVTCYELDVFFNSIDFPVWRREFDGRMVFYNDAYSRLVEEVSTDLESFVSELGKSCIEKGGEIISVSKNLTIDGKNQVFQFLEKVASNKSGTVGYALQAGEKNSIKKEAVFLRDILQSMMSTSHVPIIILDVEQRVIFYNESFCATFKIESDWLKKKPYYATLLDKLGELNQLPEVSDHKSYKTNMIDTICNLKEQDYVMLDLKWDVVFKLLMSPINGGGTVLRYQNMTDAIAIERSFNQLNALYKDTLSNIQEPIIIFSSDGKIQVCNDAFIAFFKVSQEDIAHRMHFKDVVRKYYFKFCDTKKAKEVEKSIIASLKNAEYTNSITIKAHKRVIKIISTSNNTSQIHHHMIT